MASSTTDWIAIEGAYRAGKNSLRNIAKEYGTAESTIRTRAKKNGWIRDPEGIKRERVRAAMSGAAQAYAHCATPINPGASDEATARTLAEEADQDIADMRAGLDVARRVIYRLGVMIEIVDDPKDIKIVAEANRIAVDTIRRIRGLDDAGGSTEIVIANRRSFGEDQD